MTVYIARVHVIARVPSNGGSVQQRSIMAKFVETNRGGKKMHFDGYVYTKIRDSSTSELRFWRCEQHRRGCEARATSEGSSAVVRKEHDHPPNPAGTATQEAIANMRKRARDESTPITSIYDDQLVEISLEDHADDALSQLPSFESLRSTLYRSRHEAIPSLPTTRRDVTFPDRYTKTLSGEDFLYVNDGDDDKIVIFTTDENIKLMSEAQAFYMDGTFSTCPALFAQVCKKFFFLRSQLLTIFSQVFTVHIILYGHTFPMAYCLLPGKQRQTYNRTFIHQKDAALVLGYTLDPFVTVSDFEIAMIQAASINFPNSSHQGCYYHFMQAIWRKVSACI